jgi:GntR family transcriptional regulator
MGALLGRLTVLRKRHPSHFKVVVNPHSSLSSEEQLLAQLKLAMMLGDLKPGDSLPSVRQLEQETKIGRNVVWRTYSKLAETGAITIEDRRRAVVNTLSQPQEASELLKVFDWLSRDVLERLRSLRVSPQSFLRFLNHQFQLSDLLSRDIVFVECNRFLTQMWAAEISTVWTLLVQGFEIASLRSLAEEERVRFRAILTPLYHHDEVQALFQNLSTRVIPLHLDWNPERIREWRGLGSRARMAIVLQKSECLGYGEGFARQLKGLCPKLQIDVIPWKSSDQVRRLLSSAKYNRALLSGPVLEAADDDVRSSPLVVKRPLTINRQSLEEARIKAGVVL